LNAGGGGDIGQAFPRHNAAATRASADDSPNKSVRSRSEGTYRRRVDNDDQCEALIIN